MDKMEIFESLQSYLPISGAADNAVKSVGRFKAPLPTIGQLISNIKKEISGTLGSDTDRALPTSKIFNIISPYWQTILNYLYEQGITSYPEVFFEPLFNDEVRIFSLLLFSAWDRSLTDGNKTISHGRGISLDFEEAISKVIGEILERYTLTIYQRKNFIRASAKTLLKSGKNILNIFDLAGFSDWQKELFPKRKFNEDSVFHWANGVELLNGKEALIPAQLIFWNYDTLQEPSEPYLRQPNTNGAAGHFSREEAILAAIYESIQRDTFLIHWLNNIAPPKIDTTTIENNDLKNLINNFSRYGFEAIFLNTTLDLEVPSCVCILVNNSVVGPKMAMGGGCGPNLEDALMRGITEAMGVYHWLRNKNGSFSLEGNYESFRDSKINQEKRLLLWADEKMFPIITDTFLSGPIQSLKNAFNNFPSSFETPKKELAYMLDIFKKRGAGYEIYVYDANHIILKTLGYHSVRVIIPALAPLYLRETDAPLGSARLKEVPLKFNYKVAEKFNPWPHPFP